MIYSIEKCKVILEYLDDKIATWNCLHKQNIEEDGPVEASKDMIKYLNGCKRDVLKEIGKIALEKDKEEK